MQNVFYTNNPTTSTYASTEAAQVQNEPPLKMVLIIATWCPVESSPGNILN